MLAEYPKMNSGSRAEPINDQEMRAGAPQQRLGVVAAYLSADLAVPMFVSRSAPWRLDKLAAS